MGFDVASFGMGRGAANPFSSGGGIGAGSAGKAHHAQKFGASSGQGQGADQTGINDPGFQTALANRAQQVNFAPAAPYNAGHSLNISA